MTLAVLAIVLFVAQIGTYRYPDVAAFDYSGRDLALIKMAAALRLTACLSLLLALSFLMASPQVR